MPKILIDTTDLYEINEALDLLQISRATLFRWIRNGKITPLKLGRRTLIPLSEIKRLNNEQVNNEQAIKV